MIGKELWEKIEKSQGYAFISDDIINRPDEFVLQRAENALAWERESVKILSNFIRKHKRATRFVHGTQTERTV